MENDQSYVFSALVSLPARLAGLLFFLLGASANKCNHLLIQISSYFLVRAQGLGVSPSNNEKGGATWLRLSRSYGID